MGAVVRWRWYWRWPLLVGAAIAAAALVVIFVREALAPRVTVNGEALTWVDWTSVIGVPLAIAGLMATYIQLLYVRSAADAAREAVDDALAELAKSDLLVDFQVLRQLEYDQAMVPGADRDPVQRWIREIRDVTGRIASALESADAQDPLITDVLAVRDAASAARVLIIGGRANLNLWNVTRKLRQELVPTCDKIATRMNELRRDVHHAGGEDVS